MKKTLLLFVLLVISTTSYAREKEYDYWGSLNDGGIKSIVPYPHFITMILTRENVNPSSYGKYLGFSVFIKTTNVMKKVSIYIQIFDKEDKRIKAIWDKSIKGTTGWKRYYTPHIYIPLHAKSIHAGVTLTGAGKVEYYDKELKEYSYK